MIVSDTGPLITWARVHQLDLLRELVGRLVLPAGVAEELTEHPGRIGVSLLQEDWIEVRFLSVRPPAEPFPRALGKGEREAIQLALHLHSRLLVDDARAHRDAQGRGLFTLTTLRLLAQAKRHSQIPEVGPLLQRMRQEGFWISDQVVQPYLQSLGEAL